MAAGDRTSDVWGERTPFAGGSDWPTRVDSHLEVAETAVERWVQSACVLCSNGWPRYRGRRWPDRRCAWTCRGSCQPRSPRAEGSVRLAGEQLARPADAAVDPP